MLQNLDDKRSLETHWFTNGNDKNMGGNLACFAAAVRGRYFGGGVLARKMDAVAGLLCGMRGGVRVAMAQAGLM